MTGLPEPFHLTLDRFLKGPEAADEGVELVIDRILAKKLPAVLADIAEDDPEALHLSPDLFSTHSTVRPGFRFVAISTGVLLLDDRLRIVGTYAGCDLVLKPALQGFGLGRELVLERALRDGSIPVWHLDEPGYSPAGLAAHISAWGHAQDDPDSIAERLARIDGRIL